MILSAAASIEIHKQQINELNVFPVPDGDTGTNMSMTLNAAAADLRKAGSVTLTKAADITASAMLRGARGNSGVILSLLFRGFSKALKGVEACTGEQLAMALRGGVEAAYKAVMKPTEGTILTVARVSADTAMETADSGADCEAVLEATVRSAAEALAQTVNQNPVLQKAGVAVFLQEGIEEQQVELGVIGREHRAGRQERGQQLGKGLLADALLAEQVVRDARQLHDARRQAARTADELIDLLRAGGGQANGGKFNDLIALPAQAARFRVENEDGVTAREQRLQRIRHRLPPWVKKSSRQIPGDNCGQRRIMQQEHSSRDFWSSQDSESAGVLCVPARGMPHP